MIRQARSRAEHARRIAKVWAYSRAYEDVAWETASPHAWDRVACIASEYARGDIDWQRARFYIEDTTAHVRRSR